MDSVDIAPELRDLITSYFALGRHVSGLQFEFRDFERDMLLAAVRSSDPTLWQFPQDEGERQNTAIAIHLLVDAYLNAHMATNKPWDLTQGIINVLTTPRIQLGWTTHVMGNPAWLVPVLEERVVDRSHGPVTNQLIRQLDGGRARARHFFMSLTSQKKRFLQRQNIEALAVACGIAGSMYLSLASGSPRSIAGAGVSANQHGLNKRSYELIVHLASTSWHGGAARIDAIQGVAQGLKK